VIGLSLILAHPELPTCADCVQWLHDARTWERARHRGQWVPRGGGPTPCPVCPKAKDQAGPLRRPAPEADLSAKNERALALYYRIKAGAPMPDDPLVQQNCGLIQMVLDQHERATQAAGPQLAQLLGGIVKRR
jgi:hypothetical protein